MEEYKVLITKASDWEYEEEITIRKSNFGNFILSFIKEEGGIIIEPKKDWNPEYDYEIKVYDDYVE